MLFWYFDPGSTGTNDVRDRMTDHTPTIAYGHRDELSVARYVQDTGSPDPARLRQLISGEPEPDHIDERIRRAMLTIREQPDRRSSAADLAAAANLSTSRFLHLFSANAGTSFRRYRLWTRMLHVAVAVSRGLDLTAASTEAGFASPSHFSDTFHAMFGITAKALLSSPTRIIVRDPPA